MRNVHVIHTDKRLLSKPTDLFMPANRYSLTTLPPGFASLRFAMTEGVKEHGAPDSRGWHFLVSCFHCSAAACAVSQAIAESLLERSYLLPCIQEFPDPHLAPCEKKQKILNQLRRRRTVIGGPTRPPTSGQRLGSSRLITKRRRHAERVRGAG